MDEPEKFRREVAGNIKGLESDTDLQAFSRVWLREISAYKYTYNFRWLGRPVIQLPQDMIATQEIIWDTRPDVIIETGVAHGGSIIYYASLLKLLGGDRKVIGIDIDIRQHNRAEIEKHPVFSHIELIEGSSVDDDVFQRVRGAVSEYQNVMVILDSNHTHEHVLQELNAYSQLVTKGNYLIVMDTLVDDMPAAFFEDRPWGENDNPKTAVRQFLTENSRFEVDKAIEAKILLTVAPSGYLKCIKS